MERVPLSVLLLVSLLSGSCRPPDSSVQQESKPSTQTYQVQGVLRGINFADRSVTVEHEEIPDYMPAMTMPFDVKAMTEVEPLKAGDAIEFTMVVTDTSAWIEGVKKIPIGEIHIERKTSVEPSRTANVERLREGDPLPAFHLIDSKGRDVTNATFSEGPLVLTFIFTRCPIPNFCPLMSSNFKQLQEALAATSETRGKVQLLSISIDPEFDTPEVLAQYASLHTTDTDGWRFAKGSPEQTERLTRAFAVSVQTESGTINHGLATALVGADGIIRKIWRGNGWKPEEVIAAVGEP
jgi:protein SCO1/2